MANELGVPLRPLSPSFDPSYSRSNNGVWGLDTGRIQDELARERELKTRARRALGAARGVLSVVRACGSRIAFRCRNRSAYPRRSSTPPVVFITGPQQPLSSMSLAQLNALRSNLEAEEEGLMEKLRELWQHLAMGSHLQPAFVDPERLAHVTQLLLEGDTESVARDPDKDEVSGAATMQLTSQRLETALLEVHAHMQAVCEERRRRKGLHGAVRVPGGASDDWAARAAGPLSPRFGLASRGPGTITAAGELSTRYKWAPMVTADSAANSAVPSATVAVTTPANVVTVPDGYSHGRGVDEMPKRKLSAISLSQGFMEDHTHSPKGSASPRPRMVGRWRARLTRRAGTNLQVPTSWPAADGDEAQRLCFLELGYTKLPTHD